MVICLGSMVTLLAIRITVICRINADPRFDTIQENTTCVEIRYADINGTITGEEAIKLARKFVRLTKLHGVPFQTGMQRTDSADGWISFYDEQQCIAQIYLYGSELSYSPDGQLIFTLYGEAYKTLESEMVNALRNDQL